MDDTFVQDGGQGPLTATGPVVAGRGLCATVKKSIRGILQHRVGWSDLAWPLRIVRAHWPLLGLVVCLVFLAAELLALLGEGSMETPVLGDLPGFFQCKYISPEDQKPLTYDLYLPPHFQGQEGPFPLIIFLAGYGEQKGDLRIGLAPFIRKQVKGGGRFDFVAFFPSQVGLTNAPRMLEMLDYVINKHHIDRDRVALTGHSSGGGQVWALAKEYPDRWAALAPVCAGGGPDVERVRHIPCWVFHGGADDLPPPETARGFVQRLRDAGGEVRYTEYPGEGHLIWPKVYDTPELYRWFAEKRRR